MTTDAQAVLAKFQRESPAVAAAPAGVLKVEMLSTGGIRILHPHGNWTLPKITKLDIKTPQDDEGVWEHRVFNKTHQNNLYDRLSDEFGVERDTLKNRLYTALYREGGPGYEREKPLHDSETLYQRARKILLDQGYLPVVR